jgi:hypothetical protein
MKKGRVPTGEPASMLVIFVAEDGAQLTTFDK